MSLVIAAYDEEDVIAREGAQRARARLPARPARADRLLRRVDRPTVERARDAGADLVLDLPRGGKVRAQDAGVERASGDLIAFSDANSTWEPDALRRLVEPFADPGVGYVCGQVRFVNDGGDSQEGAYWRYEMAVRELESRLGGRDRGQRRDLRRAPARPTSRSTRAWATTCRSRST